MFLDLPLITNIVQLTRHRQAQIDLCLLRINARRVSHDYAVDEKVYYHNFDRNKLEAVRFGPFEILRVHTNNMVTIRRGLTEEHVSICHLTPFRLS